MSDGLASIAGLAPLVLMDVGEEKEVGSASSKSVYKVKRHEDHYFWCVSPPYPPFSSSNQTVSTPSCLPLPLTPNFTPSMSRETHKRKPTPNPNARTRIQRTRTHSSCPAWRNQKGVATDARTCKHLKALLGEAYENARIVAKGGEVKPAASKAKAAPKTKAEPKAKPASKAKAEPKAKPASKAKAPARGRARKGAGKQEDAEDGEDEEEQEEEEDADAEPPAKRARTARGAKATSTVAASKAKGKGKGAPATEEEDAEEEAEAEHKDSEEVKPEEGVEGMDVDNADLNGTHTPPPSSSF